MLRWCLCMPREMQKEDISKWDLFCKDRESNKTPISYIDGNEIIQKMKKCDRLKDTDFISRYFTVPEIQRYTETRIPNCLTPIPSLNHSVGLIGREETITQVLYINGDFTWQIDYLSYSSTYHWNGAYSFVLVSSDRFTSGGVLFRYLIGYRCCDYCIVKKERQRIVNQIEWIVQIGDFKNRVMKQCD